MGLIKSDEPFMNLLTQGMVTLGGSAMSKSKGNIVSPDEIVSKYGADTARLFILFAAPPEKQLDWSSDGVEGCWRFINRVWRLQEVVNTKSSVPATDKAKQDLLRAMHVCIKKVTEDISLKHQFNTAISSVMELVNTMYLILQVAMAARVGDSRMTPSNSMAVVTKANMGKLSDISGTEAISSVKNQRTVGS